jgi:hypothetical protein
VKPKLSQDPREWGKFGLSASVVLGLVVGWMAYRRALPGAGQAGLVLLVGLLLATAWGRPRTWKAAYCWGMTLGGWIGTVVGGLFLTLVFVLLVLPLGWGLRAMGRDLLSLGRVRGSGSYWREAPPLGPLDRQF